jgi:hypothetical protein
LPDEQITRHNCVICHFGVGRKCRVNDLNYLLEARIASKRFLIKMSNVILNPVTRKTSSISLATKSFLLVRVYTPCQVTCAWCPRWLSEKKALDYTLLLAVFKKSERCKIIVFGRMIFMLLAVIKGTGTTDTTGIQWGRQAHWGWCQVGY